MSTPYQDPMLTVAVLDFRKPGETRLCLESVKRHVKFAHQVLYLHNGPAEHAYQFYQDGLVDTFIQTRDNGGLGLGTRLTFAASFGQYTLSLQNDQIISRDFEYEEFSLLCRSLGRQMAAQNMPVATVKSISLAGPVCGMHIYSERAHLIKTSFYREMEMAGLLGPHGAGPYHDGPWREEQIQRHYRENAYIHYTWEHPLVTDNGRTAERQNADGSLWRHETDTKRLWLVQGPIKERGVYPKLNDDEWARVLLTQSWPDGAIPANEVAHSFTVPSWHPTL